jgi:ABC-2 type transport system ATP-binding protein
VHERRRERERVMTDAVEVEGLVKRYGNVRAVDGLTFRVRSGEIFGLLGPNGAGKTTTLAVLEGLRSFDAGQVRVLGYEMRREARLAKRRLGVQLQSTTLLPDFTALQQVLLVGRLYGHALPPAEGRALLEWLGLGACARRTPARLSGGQRQRLALALALVNDPDLVFLDEPTAGLDPQSRRSLWDLIRGLSGRGRTVVLTTHHIEEAEALCDRVAIVDHGRLVALDTPAALVARRRGVAWPGPEVRPASLEDVFLALTGRTVRGS